MDKVFEALASRIRREILAYLQGGELTAGEIAQRFSISKPAVSTHLRVLESADLISRDKRGQYVYFALKPNRIENTILSWAFDFCPVAKPLKEESIELAQNKTQLKSNTKT